MKVGYKSHLKKKNKSEYFRLRKKTSPSIGVFGVFDLGFL